jgi:hypothetical protein
VGSEAHVAGLSLVAERMAGRRHRVASVIVHRLPDAGAETDERETEKENAHGH